VEAELGIYNYANNETKWVFRGARNSSELTYEPRSFNNDHFAKHSHVQNSQLKGQMCHYHCLRKTTMMSQFSIPTPQRACGLHKS
jgi:hypothetical protein